MANIRKDKRFDQLLQVMITQPVPSEKLAKEARISKQADASSYGDTRTRAGKAASASSKPKRTSQSQDETFPGPPAATQPRFRNRAGWRIGSIGTLLKDR